MALSLFVFFFKQVEKNAEVILVDIKYTITFVNEHSFPIFYWNSSYENDKL